MLSYCNDWKASNYLHQTGQSFVADFCLLIMALMTMLIQAELETLRQVHAQGLEAVRQLEADMDGDGDSEAESETPSQLADDEAAKNAAANAKSRFLKAGAGMSVKPA